MDGAWNVFGYLILAGVGIALLGFGDLVGQVVGAVLLAMSIGMVGLMATRHPDVRALRRDRGRNRL